MSASGKAVFAGTEQSDGQSKESDVAAGARAPLKRSQISCRYADSWTVSVVEFTKEAMKLPDGFYAIGNLQKKRLGI